MHLVEFGGGPAQLLQHRLAGGGDLDAARGAVEQGDAELPLQQRDLGADAGLADVQEVRGRGEGPLLGHRQRVSDLMHFHQL